MSIRNLAIIGLASAMCITSALAQEEPREDNRPYLGIKAGLYMPSDGEMRDIFGSSIFVFGISFDDFSKQADKWRLTLDFDFITGRDGDNKFFALPVTASVGRVFGGEDDQFRPFVRVGAGAAYMDYSLTRPSTAQRFSVKRGAATADAEVGVFFGDRIRLSAKYVWFSKVDDFDFSGLQLTATFNLVRF